MLKLVVLVSGGGTNLQAIIDGIADGSIPNTEIKAVISNNKNAYALQRAKDHNIAAACVSPKDFADRAAFNQALLEKIKSYEPDLIVLAGCLVVIPEIMVDAYPNKIINIHPSLIPAFCGTGYYGLKVHEGVLKRGVKVTGATVHFVDKGTDTGPIIIQKAVELGVFSVVPVETRRCVVKLDEKKASKKTARWQQIAESAAKQSKRMLVPEVRSVMTFKEALVYAKELDVLLIPYELAKGMKETKELIRSIEPGKSIGVFIGPEGGFEEQEVADAMEAGAKPITLGHRILRTETAGLAVLSVLMFQLEDE